MSFSVGQATCQEYDHDFGDIAGQWLIIYDDNSTATLHAHEDGSATLIVGNEAARRLTSGSGAGMLQPVTGKDAEAGWQYRLVLASALHEQHLLKIEKGSLLVQFGPRMQSPSAINASSVSAKGGVGHTVVPASDEQPAGSPMMMIAGIAVGLLACTGLTIAGVCCYRRSRNQSHHNGEQANCQTDPEAQVEREISPKSNGNFSSDRTPRLLGSERSISRGKLEHALEEGKVSSDQAEVVGSESAPVEEVESHFFNAALAGGFGPQPLVPQHIGFSIGDDGSTRPGFPGSGAGCVEDDETSNASCVLVDREATSLKVHCSAQRPPMK